LEICTELRIGKPQDCETHTAQDGVALCVGCQLILMVRAVQFNDQSGAGTVEIHDELADHMLSAKVSLT
jgi:hypothetical protein